MQGTCHDTAVLGHDTAKMGRDTADLAQGRVAARARGMAGRMCRDTINCIMTGEWPGC